MKSVLACLLFLGLVLGCAAPSKQTTEANTKANENSEAKASTNPLDLSEDKNPDPGLFSNTKGDTVNSGENVSVPQADPNHKLGTLKQEPLKPGEATGETGTRVIINGQEVGATGSRHQPKIDTRADKGTIVNEKGEKITWGTSASEEQLGLPFYPNSKPMQPGGTIVETPKTVLVTSQRKSLDTPEKIHAFYQPKLKTVDISNLTEHAAILTGQLEDGRAVTIGIDHNPETKETVISIAVEMKK